MEIDILIDELTDCLVEKSTGETVETEYYSRTLSIMESEYKNWKFNWQTTEENGYTIYELFVKGDSTVQGRISLKIDGGLADIDIVETAPHNYGSFGKYEGIGGHLFAIACQISLESGCDGYVAFTAKSSLIDYYRSTLGAKVFRGQRMYIDEVFATRLINKYLKGR